MLFRVAAVAAVVLLGSASAFQHYSRLHPPVHIVVGGGHVTLEGVVNNKLDKALARSLAW